jgi:hypothetical protein
LGLRVLAQHDPSWFSLPLDDKAHCVDRLYSLFEGGDRKSGLTKQEVIEEFLGPDGNLHFPVIGGVEEEQD